MSFSADTDSTGIATDAQSTNRSPTVAVPFIKPLRAGTELAIQLGQQAARRGHDVVDPARHRAHLAQPLGCIVEPIPQDR